ncbi:acyl-CoA carboxylase epsilon subunit [uncultured Phycicoccus sp.]|uniref:acyl-CoA carboxylase epsilon subunit n=1 Tax=uncultured Phycicoccus sp. TaxID=661422 RepID=UPI0026214A82|nr:acyl-CoA carboxylase epsilon subunit [uncultured Phycicoccus sp.]
MTEPSAIRVHGPATAEDIAAVVAVLAAASGGTGGAGGASGDGWHGRAQESRWASHRSLLLRGRHDPGPAAWRSTFRG